MDFDELRAHRLTCDHHPHQRAAVPHGDNPAAGQHSFPFEQRERLALFAFERLCIFVRDRPRHVRLVGLKLELLQVFGFEGHNCHPSCVVTLGMMASNVAGKG